MVENIKIEPSGAAFVENHNGGNACKVIGVLKDEALEGNGGFMLHVNNNSEYGIGKPIEIGEHQGIELEGHELEIENRTASKRVDENIKIKPSVAALVDDQNAGNVCSGIGVGKDATPEENCEFMIKNNVESDFGKTLIFATRGAGVETRKKSRIEKHGREY